MICGLGGLIVLRAGTLYLVALNCMFLWWFPLNVGIFCVHFVPIADFKCRVVT